MGAMGRGAGDRPGLLMILTGARSRSLVSKTHRPPAQELCYPGRPTAGSSGGHPAVLGAAAEPGC